MPRKKRLTPPRRLGPNLGALSTLDPLAPDGVVTLDGVKLAVSQEHSEHPRLWYVEHGVMHVGAQGARRVIPPCHAVYLGPGVTASFEAREPVGLRGVAFADPASWPATPVAGFFVSTLGQELIADLAGRPTDHPARAATFACLCAHTRDWIAAGPDPHLAGAHHPALQRVMRFATEQMHREPTIEDAAALIGVSSRTLARRFADETDTSWRRFLHEARMLRAIELLVDPTASVQDIAYAIGFNSIGAFTRAFQEYTGTTPREWRRRIRRR